MAQTSEEADIEIRAFQINSLYDKGFDVEALLNMCVDKVDKDKIDSLLDTVNFKSPPPSFFDWYYKEFGNKPEEEGEE